LVRILELEKNFHIIKLTNLRTFSISGLVRKAEGFPLHPKVSSILWSSTPFPGVLLPFWKHEKQILLYLYLSKLIQKSTNFKHNDFPV